MTEYLAGFSRIAVEDNLKLHKVYGEFPIDAENFKAASKEANRYLTRLRIASLNPTISLESLIETKDPQPIFHLVK